MDFTKIFFLTGFQHYKKFTYYFSLLFLISFAIVSHASKEEQPPAIGNFALPSSQQPGSLLAFGENIIDKNETVFFILFDDFAGVNKHFIDAIPGVLYGITDSFSIFVNTPFAVSYQDGNQKSAGFEDAFIQLEYAYYTKSTSTYQDQATIVGNVTLPTGSITKQPNTGIGAVSFFFGTTFLRSYVDWLFFVSPGAVLTTAKNGTKFGNSYLYQFGFGRNINCSTKNNWILAWVLEFDGTYSQRNRVQGVIDPDSGGNVIYALPSLWISNKNLIIQLGAGYAVQQRLLGNQSRDTYLLVANFGWAIY